MLEKLIGTLIYGLLFVVMVWLTVTSFDQELYALTFVGVVLGALALDLLAKDALSD